jgi:quinol monooxygenase YgiN
MKTMRGIIVSAALLASVSFPAFAQNTPIPVIEGPTYVMTYVEVVPSATNTAIAALKEYRDAARKEQGANFVDVFQEEGQSYRFVVSEIWQNRASAQAHANAASSSGLVAKVKGIELGPIDVRTHQAHAVTPPKAPSSGTVVVISHADVAGGNTQNLMRAFGPLNEGSQKDSGMARYEILDEVPAHPNHFRLFEEWANLAAFEAHNRSAHSQTFRQTILQWLGTPYDQRIYRLVN